MAFCKSRRKTRIKKQNESMGVLYPKSKDMYKTNSLDESDLLVHCCVMLEILKLRHFWTVDGLGNYGWITHVLTQVLFVI